jgi:tetratricopeptide (TPR) repeat protein
LNRKLVSCFAAIALSVCAGCQSDGHTPESRRAVQAFFLGNPSASARQLEPLAAKPDRNYVLNNLRLGAAHLARQDFEEAQAALVRAYEVLNSTRVNDAGRQTAAVLFDEKIKIWRGEPYERAVANLYLGLSFYQQGDYQNARGAFENALFKLRDYGNKREVKSNDYASVESDFAIAMLMLGRCWEKLGEPDDAEAQWSRLAMLRPDARELVARMQSPRVNVMVVVDVGFGPRKVSDFDGSIVAFSPTPGEAGGVPVPRITINGQEVDPNGIVALYDTVRMAQDRKWQSIDTIRVFKSGLGTALIAGGAITTGYGLNRDDGDTALVGLGLIAAGLLAKATSQADLRQWEMVPRSTIVIPLEVEPGPFELTMTLPGGISQNWQGFVAPRAGEHDVLVYLRAMRFMNGNYTLREQTRATPVSGSPVQ